MTHSPATPSGPSAHGAIFAKFQKIGVRGSVLSVCSGVDQRVYDAGRPGEDGGDDVQPGVRDAVVCHVHDHEGEEAREETQEDGQHQRCEAGIFLFLFCCLTGEFAVDNE